MLHTENGMLGMGRNARADEVDPDLIKASKTSVTENLGASYSHHADSFAMVRGAELRDVEVAERLPVPIRGLA